MEMFALTLSTFGVYAVVSLFFLLWIPGIVPAYGLFFILASLIFVLLYCVRSVGFYDSLNRALCTGWMRYFAFNALLFLLAAAWIFVMLLLRGSALPEYWGQLLGTALIAYFFGFLPIPPAFKKSKKAGLYAVASLFCALAGFLLLCLAWKILYYAVSAPVVIIEKLG